MDVFYNMAFESMDLEFNSESYKANTGTTPDLDGWRQYRIFGENGLGLDRIWGNNQHRI